MSKKVIEKNVLPRKLGIFKYEGDNSTDIKLKSWKLFYKKKNEIYYFKV